MLLYKSKSTMIFWIEFPPNCSLFCINNSKQPLPLGELNIKKIAPVALQPNAFPCRDIRRNKDEELEYYVEGYNWVVLRQENGAKLWTNPEILQVSFNNDIVITTVYTKVPNALWHLAEAITDKKYASKIALDMFAREINHPM
jgi:hypothetical protein